MTVRSVSREWAQLDGKPWVFGVIIRIMWVLKRAVFLTTKAFVVDSKWAFGEISDTYLTVNRNVYRIFKNLLRVLIIP